MNAKSELLEHIGNRAVKHIRIKHGGCPWDEDDGSEWWDYKKCPEIGKDED